MEVKSPITETNPMPGRCSFFVERKHRFCKLEAASGRKYCAQHLTAEQGDNSNANDGAPLRKRIPCPLDPKHSCFADKLKKHLKKCNAREKDLPAYHVKGINRIGVNDTGQQQQLPLSSLSKEELGKLIDCVKKVNKANPLHIPSAIQSHPVLVEEISKPFNGPSAKKHLCQMASLLGQLQQAKLLGPDTCYVEFGAGRGHMSHWVQQAVAGQSNVSFLLVDRAHVRHKMDTAHRFQQDGPQYERIRIDIEHLHLGNVPITSNPSTPLTAYSKHLCGAATDLTLQCLMETLQPNPNINEDSSTSNPSRSRVNGIVIALCCHHRCDWSSFVGRDWWLAQGLTSKDFMAVSHMSSWATCGPATGRWKKSNNVTGQKSQEDLQHESQVDVTDEKLEQSDVNDSDTVKHVEEVARTSGKGPDESTEDGGGHRSKVSRMEADSDVHSCGGDIPAQRLVGLDVTEREVVGRQCKRLIDFGRIAYLHSHGFKSQLVYYVDKEMSLENVALVALPDTQL